jgi:hypothetical protein
MSRCAHLLLHCGCMIWAFNYKQFSKGVYFDGHEREDVVAAR